MVVVRVGARVIGELACACLLDRGPLGGQSQLVPGLQPHDVNLLASGVVAAECIRNPTTMFLIWDGTPDNRVIPDAGNGSRPVSWRARHRQDRRWHAATLFVPRGDSEPVPKTSETTLPRCATPHG